MTRPRIVRADTLDLQDQHAPSAQDHSKHPTPQAGIAPHQEQSIRHADQDSRSEMKHGPGSEGQNLEVDDYRDGIDIYDDDDDDDEDDLDGELGHHRGDRGDGSEEGDLADGESDDMMDDDMMDKISSSPSIDDDIDFEFVYALHNFVATVDGQANAAKGDNMVLLDDSNSYWWLVRIVKDGSIGYLPAEHIETPTERLARLNKHRNVDLSATMLGDNSEKSKNPLKKAMRRRNAKTVAFTSPTYIEASDIDFSTDDELDDDASFNDEELSREEVDDLQEDQTEDIVVEPLRPKQHRDRGSEELEDIHETQETELTSPDSHRSSQEIFENDVENNVSRSRNGTVRNTDSFFKDDTVETKKISLTPNLLRDENAGGNGASDTKERASLDAIEKTLRADDKVKDDKKRKDKKPGMLSGLFKRKDKKTRTTEDDGEDLEKISGESSRTSPQPKTSLDSLSSPEARSPKPLVIRQSSRLQKQPPGVTSPTKQEFQQGPTLQSPVEVSERALSAEGQKAAQTIRQVAAEDDSPLSPGSTRSNQQDHDVSSPAGPSSPFTNPFHSHSDSIDETMQSPAEFQREQQELSDRTASVQHSVTSPPQKFTPKQSMDYQNQRLDSPVNVSPVDRQVSPTAPGLTTDLSSPGGHSPSPVSPSISPVVEINDRKSVDVSSPAPFDTASIGTPTWSDASLRSYLDDDNDIRDLFYIVHDNSNVPPAGPDHPITGSLFKEESKRLREMTGQLDAMLADWVGRRVQNPAGKLSSP